MNSRSSIQAVIPIIISEQHLDPRKQGSLTYEVYITFTQWGPCMSGNRRSERVIDAAHNHYSARSMRLLQGLSRRFWCMHYRTAADLPLCARLHANQARAIARGTPGLPHKPAISSWTMSKALPARRLRCERRDRRRHFVVAHVSEGAIISQIYQMTKSTSRCCREG